MLAKLVHFVSLSSLIVSSAAQMCSNVYPQLSCGLRYVLTIIVIIFRRHVVRNVKLFFIHSLCHSLIQVLNRD
jgi:hypothetical protein